MKRSPKLLFFAYAFPPSRAIGAVRCWNIAKHLSRRGWDVEVVTINPALLTEPQPGMDVIADCVRENIRLRPTGFDWPILTGGGIKLAPWQPNILARIARRVVNWIKLDPDRGWITAAVRACASLGPGDMDAVLVSAPPHIAFEAGANVARRLAVPLFLDYRDLWSLNPHSKRNATRKVWDLEARLLGFAQAVTVVSPSMSALLKSEFQFNKPIEVITNGFDNEEFDGIRPEGFDDFAVVYAGRFYPPSSTAKPLLEAIALVNRDKAQEQPVRLHYFGSDQKHVKTAAVEAGASSWLINHGNVSRKIVLAALKGASAAAVVTTVEETATQAEMGILTGKLFDALGAQVPVLLISPKESDASTLVRENNFGGAFTGCESVAMGKWLSKLREDAKKHSGSSENFSWLQISAQLDVFLRGLLPKK